MSISDTLQAKKYASIAEVAAAQAKVYADKLDNAPGYAEDAERFANLAGEYSDSAQSASASAAQSSSSAIQSAESAAESASLAASAAEQAIQQSIGTTLRGPEDEQISQLPAKSARQNTVVSFGGDGESELLSLAGFALLDSNGKVPLSNIPAAAITEVFVASSQAEMLASNAQPGDVVKRTDIGSSFILMSSPATTLSNWILITDDVLAQLAAPGGVSLVNGAVSQTALSSSSGSTLSLSQVATAYGLDYSLGAVWSQGASTSSANWWLYNNLVYKSFANTTLGSAPDLDAFYIVPVSGNYTDTNFGISTSNPSAAKMSNIASVVNAAKRPLVFANNVSISLESDLSLSFNYVINDGVSVTFNSVLSATRYITVARSNAKVYGLTLGSGVNVRIDSSSSILKSVEIKNCSFTLGGISCTGSNRGYGLKITNNTFPNDAGTLVNSIQFGDWCDVDIISNKGARCTNAFILINPQYSYTCFNLNIEDNSYQQGKLFGIALSGAAEIGCINNFSIKRNNITLPMTGNTRALVMQNSNNGEVSGNNLTGSIHTAADACQKIKYVGNNVSFVGTVGLRARSCSGWVYSGNTSNTNASSSYHVEFSSTSAAPTQGISGRLSIGGNTYYGGSRGVLISSGIYYSVGVETFISPTQDTSVGVISVASSSFNSTIDGNQRSIKPSGNALVTNSSSNSVVDGPALHSTSASTITAVVNGAVVSSLHGKAYHFTVGLNNNLDNFQAAFLGSEGKIVSEWAATISGAKLAINASPFLNNSGVFRIQDSYYNGIPTPYTDKSTMTNIYAGCVMHRNGSLQVRYAPQSQLDLNTLMTPQSGDDIWQSAFFNIPLIINGAISPYTHDTTAAPRTAIGQTAAGLIHVIVVDGRNADSAGCTTVELANYLLSQGCVTAFNLDGGGSSTMWYNGSVINVPSDGSERVVAQAWVFK